MERGFLFVAIAISASVSIYASVQMSPVTAGWENSNPDRREFPATAAVWTAPKDGLRVVMSGGAEGDVSFKDGEIKISYKNAAGEEKSFTQAFEELDDGSIKIGILTYKKAEK